VRALVLPPRQRSLDDALGIGPALRIESEREDALAVGAAVVTECAVVLGRMQRAGRVLDARCFGADAGALPRVVRRATTGAHVHLDGEAFVFALALPSLDHVFRDAEPRTLLNRNLRLFLRAFAQVGVPATYFGRDFLSAKRLPFALVGFDVSPRGTVTIELWLRREGSLALPPELATDVERATTRFGGRAPEGIDALGAGLPSLELAERVLEGVLERVDATAEPCRVVLAPPPYARVDHAASPLPEDAGPPDIVAAPIGWLDLAPTPRGVWVGGDLLAPAHALGEATPMDATSAADLPIDGALWSDVLAARDALRR
jgi:hypothetical protein